MQRESIAFFDVDHTITRRATPLAFAFELVRRGYIFWPYLLAVPVVFVLYRAFSLEMDFLFSRSLPKLMGISREEFEAIGREAFARYLRGKLYPGAIREIEALRERGIRVILATSSPFEAVYPLAQHCGIGAEDVVCTQFSYTDGRFDGKLVGVPVFSRYKRDIIKKFIERSGTDEQFCSFFSDSVHDLPLLELVGHPVAANPDPRLRAIARRRGWTIKDFKR